MDRMRSGRWVVVALSSMLGGDVVCLDRCEVKVDFSESALQMESGALLLALSDLLN